MPGTSEASQGRHLALVVVVLGLGMLVIADTVVVVVDNAGKGV